VQVWAWSQCPSHETAVQRVRAVLDDLGRSSVPVTVRWIETDEEAEAARFAGSPTFTVDGVDLFEPADGAVAGLSCRVYRRRDGRFSPLPDPEDLRAALTRALHALPR
jgi:hypothetical protein